MIDLRIPTLIKKVSLVPLLILLVYSCEKPERVLKISTLEPIDSLIAYREATLKGEIIDLGSEPVSEVGIVISTNSIFTQQSPVKVSGVPSKGKFEVRFTNLEPGVQYFYRSYARLKSQTEPIYANDDRTFTAKETIKPTVTIGPPTDFETSSIKFSASVTEEGGEPVTKRGFCWGLSVNPEIGNSLDTTLNGTGNGSFTGKIEGLSEGTSYHVRAYAINIKGIGYSNDVLTTTLKKSDAVSADATLIAINSAALNGTVNANNSASNVTFEWGMTTAYGNSASATPGIISGNIVTSVSAAISGLSQGTTYHFRVVSVSAAGTSAGIDKTFTTLIPVPTAATGSTGGVTSAGATINGSVNANNTSTTVTFEYGTTASYGSTVNASPNTVTGGASTPVSASLTGLLPSTTYHFRIKAANGAGAVTGSDQTFTTEAPPPTVSDIDGNMYNTVQIGDQVWMKENLKVTHYSNGELIQNVTDPTTWSALSTGALSWYDNDIDTYKDTYGALYNYYTTIDVRNVCPAGWHIPINTEFNTLTTNLGGLAVAGGKLKEIGTVHWTSPNTNATNESGFTSLGSGFRHPDGRFFQLGIRASYWLQPAGITNTNIFNLFYIEQSVTPYAEDPISLAGYSIRCIKGELPVVETLAATTVGSTTTTINGKVNPNGASTTITFEYGTSTSYGTEFAASQSPVSGTSPVDVSASLTGLTPGTTYHYRIKAVNSGGISYGVDRTFLTDLVSVTDIEGNVYPVVKIGTQLWMKENLKTTKYNDGSPITLITDRTAWYSSSTEAYCWYNNDEALNKNVYGGLYNYYAVTDVRNICPIGWHIPSMAEWNTLFDLFGGTTFAGEPLKETGTVHWASPNYATNYSGFTALPGGLRDGSGFFIWMGATGRFWTSTPLSVGLGIIILTYDFNSVAGDDSNRKSGFSVRCLKN